MDYYQKYLKYKKKYLELKGGQNAAVPNLQMRRNRLQEKLDDLIIEREDQLKNDNLNKQLRAIDINLTRLNTDLNNIINTIEDDNTRTLISTESINFMAYLSKYNNNIYNDVVERYVKINMLGGQTPYQTWPLYNRLDSFIQFMINNNVAESICSNTENFLRTIIVYKQERLNIRLQIEYRRNINRFINQITTELRELTGLIILQQIGLNNYENTQNARR